MHPVASGGSKGVARGVQWSPQLRKLAPPIAPQKRRYSIHNAMLLLNNNILAPWKICIYKASPSKKLPYNLQCL